MNKTINCTHCKKRIPDQEFIVNWGWCNDCFNADYTEYIESSAGPYDWVVSANDDS